MQRIATKLILTASLAALIFATPVSLATAQAHPNREATARSAGGGDRQAAHNAGDRQGADARANNAKVNNAKIDDAKINNAKVNNAKVNNAKVNNAKVNNAKVNNVNVNDVNVNNVNATNVNAAYVRRPLTTGVAVAGTAVAVGTTVAVLPASCTTVIYDDVTYHHCGSTYYVAADGAYVAVNPPR
jgi:hypothetical protein